MLSGSMKESDGLRATTQPALYMRARAEQRPMLEHARGQEDPYSYAQACLQVTTHQLSRNSSLLEQTSSIVAPH